MVKAHHLVVDSGGFLKNADIRSMGENIYCVKEVVAEIRDKPTRRRLAVLPYEIIFKVPSPESIQKVIDVAKKTGDYPSLSSVDIKVLALTFELTKQNDPDIIQEVGTMLKGDFQFGGSKGSNDTLPGFYMPKEEEVEEEDSQDVEERMVELQIEDAEKKDTPRNPAEEEEESSGEENEFNDNDGWITPGNIGKIHPKSQDDVEDEVEVACITTDYSMQNVLMKMGLRVFSVDGIQIKTIRSYVLRCHACFFITKIMTKVFCPKCGNNTLKRVPMEVQPDGSVKYFLSRNPKVLSKRGKKVSLPMPKGGKHAANPILCEDQPTPQNRVSKKSRQKTNVWSDDYAIDGNPFVMNETESRAFKLGIRQGNRGCGRRGNPNAVNKKFVKRR